MPKTINIVRPVGNSITTKRCELSNLPFSPFHEHYYQSGTASLAAAIIASHRLKPDIKYPEVIIPAYGCPDLVSAVVHAGAIPVLVDIELDSPNMAHEQIQSSITQNTIAVVAVRFFGIAEQYSELKAICHKSGLILIEDSAQGFPISKFDTYWQGDFIILSFGRGKPVNLLGGGAVLGRDSNLMKRLPQPAIQKESFADFIKQKVKLTLYNSSIHPLLYGLITRLPGLSIGQTIYKTLEELNYISKFTHSLLAANLAAYQNRITIQKEYHDFLETLPGKLIINLPGALDHPMQSPLLRYPILIKDVAIRNKVYDKLKYVGASLMYQQPLHKIDGVEALIKDSGREYPHASRLSGHLLTLPTHAGISSNNRLTIKNHLASIVVSPNEKVKRVYTQ